MDQYTQINLIPPFQVRREVTTNGQGYDQINILPLQSAIQHERWGWKSSNPQNKKNEDKTSNYNVHTLIEAAARDNRIMLVPKT